MTCHLSALFNNLAKEFINFIIPHNGLSFRFAHALSLTFVLCFVIVVAYLVFIPLDLEKPWLPSLENSS